MRAALWIYLGILVGFLPLQAADTRGNTLEEDVVFRSIAEAMAKAEGRLPNKTVAVYGFEVVGNPGDAYAAFATDKLTHQLVSDGRLVVIERSRIDQVLREQSLSMTGIIDSGTAARIGQILAVDAVIIGTIHVSENRLEFFARLIQSEKGIILASVEKKMNRGVAPVKPLEPLQPLQPLQPPQPLKSKSESSSSDSNQLPKSEFIMKSDRQVYSPGETIAVSYSGMPGNSGDWITLVRSSEPDNSYGDWFYTKGLKEGEHAFTAPAPGEYEIRGYFDWPNGGYVVRGRIRITVR